MGMTRDRIAAICWIATALVYLVAETIAAAAYPDYSYAENYISDLGVPAESPAHLVMNVGFVLHGVLLATAALLTARLLTRRRAFVAIAVLAGVGNVLVGLVHSGQTDSPVGPLHGVGAVLAIVGGNLTALVAGVALHRMGRRGLGATCSALGVIGLLGALALALDGNSSSIDLLADGTWERLAVYAITAFELLIGTALLRPRPR